MPEFTGFCQLPVFMLEHDIDQGCYEPRVLHTNGFHVAMSIKMALHGNRFCNPILIDDIAQKINVVHYWIQHDLDLLNLVMNA